MRIEGSSDVLQFAVIAGSGHWWCLTRLKDRSTSLRCLETHVESLKLSLRMTRDVMRPFYDQCRSGAYDAEHVMSKWCVACAVLRNRPVSRSWLSSRRGSVTRHHLLFWEGPSSPVFLTQWSSNGSSEDAAMSPS